MACERASASLALSADRCVLLRCWCRRTTARDFAHAGHFELSQVDFVVPDRLVGLAGSRRCRGLRLSPASASIRPVTSTRLPTAAFSFSSAISSSLYMACEAPPDVPTVPDVPTRRRLHVRQDVILEHTQRCSATLGARPGMSFSLYTHPVSVVEA